MKSTEDAVLTAGQLLPRSFTFLSSSSPSESMADNAVGPQTAGGHPRTRPGWTQVLVSALTGNGGVLGEQSQALPS